MTPAETALDDAVRGIIEQEYPGAIPTAWVLVAAAHSEDEGTPMLVAPAPGQPSYATLGLLHSGLFEATGRDE